MSERHLAAVPDANGEIVTVDSLKAELARAQACVKGLERDINGWRVRYRELAEDKAAEAREHVLFPVAAQLFRGWQAHCQHPGCAWTEDRFWLIEPYLALPRWGKTLEARTVGCCQAIAGAKHDSWSKPRRNGTAKVFNEWERLFGKGAGSFEEFKKRAPTDWQPNLRPAFRDLIVLCEAHLERQKAAAKVDHKRVG